jgi:hypothetical protein
MTWGSLSFVAIALTVVVEGVDPVDLVSWSAAKPVSK